MKEGCLLSPVPGTYQAIEAPAGEDTSVETQPERSVRARARVAMEAAVKMKRYILKLLSVASVIWSL